MRVFLQSTVVALILGLAASAALQQPASERVPVTSDPVEPARARVVLADVEPEPARPVTLPRKAWCEPIDPLPCRPEAGCPDTAAGFPRSCRRVWSSDLGTHACTVDWPSRGEQRWRAARLRVLVDEVCKPSKGCDPEALHDYLSALALRESTWRPYKVHRLGPDVDANKTAWRRRAHVFADNPAAGDPWRWSAGRGYYGQNAALWLDLWDVNAIPETLCGEVEATLVHLRAARRRWHALDQGAVECEGERFTGSANGRPSWGDISLVNSGRLRCPSETKEAHANFHRRAKSRGLDARRPVSLAMLGAPVPVAQQVEFADRMRQRMDELKPPSE